MIRDVLIPAQLAVEEAYQNLMLSTEDTGMDGTDAVVLLAATGVSDQDGTRTMGWSLPSRGTIKINLNASVRHLHGTGFGFAVTNHRGQVLAATTEVSGVETSPMLVETLCCRWVIGLSLELGYRSVLLETDCLHIYQAWKPRLDSPSYLSSIVQDCLSLEPNFNSCKLVHVKRQCNVVTDLLARKSFSSLSRVWLEKYHSELFPALVSDVPSLTYD